MGVRGSYPAVPAVAPSGHPNAQQVYVQREAELGLQLALIPAQGMELWETGRDLALLCHYVSRSPS
jgi:hypothetical protein